MQNAKMEFYNTCCQGSYPIRDRSMHESLICACGAPFFSWIVSNNNLPTSRRCLMEIPMDFMEDHGHKFDRAITLQENEDSGMHQVQIGGDCFVGFGFEWRDFTQAHNIGFQELVVFTLVARSQFKVQIYKLCTTCTRIRQPFKDWSWKMLELDKYLTLALMSDKIVLRMN